MKMEKSFQVRLIQFVCFVSIILLIGRSNSQKLSKIVSSLPTQQATNATVVLTVTAVPPEILLTSFWIVQWYFDGEYVGQTLFEHQTGKTVSFVERPEIAHAEISSSAPSGGNNQFTTSFTLKEIQLSDSGKYIKVKSQSVDNIPPQLFRLLVKDCPSNISSDITVKALSYEYNAQGTFKCLNNGELFYSNGERPSSSDTTCLASATWSGQDNLQCWLDCPHTISSSYNVAVEATSYIYNANGTFKCSNNGELFYSNGTRLSSSDTTCLASATWSGQDNLQCWSAPIASLVGDLTVVEGSNITLTCDYVDTTPIGSFSVFYVGDTTYTRHKNEPLVLPFLDETYNNIAVSCQALTPFTEIPAYSNRGRSFTMTRPLAPLAHNVVILDCFNDGDTAITVIFGLLILLCIGYNALYVFTYNPDHPGEWHAPGIAAILTALVGLASFLGLLIGYSVNYQRKASCFSSGEYHVLTSGELGGIIAGCSIFYLGCYISMLIWYLTHKPAFMSNSTTDGEKDGGQETDAATAGFVCYANKVDKNGEKIDTTGMRAKATPERNSIKT